MTGGETKCAVALQMALFFSFFFSQPPMKKQYRGVWGGEAAGARGDSARKVGREDRAEQACAV